MRKIDRELFDAVKQGNLSMVQRCLNRGANVHAVYTVLDIKPIHIAARKGHREIIEFLLNKGASVSDRDKDGWAPLHYATKRGHLEVIQFLLEKGADINARDGDGKIPLDLAREEGHIGIVNVLNSIKEKESFSTRYASLCAAAEFGNLEAIKFLINNGVNAKNNDSKTLLDIAREKGHTEIVDILNAIKKIRFYLMPPCAPSAKAGDLEAAKYLINKGIVSIDETDKDGLTLLHYATQAGELDVVEFLIEKGANISAEDNNGKTPLDYAREEGYTEIVEYMISRATLLKKQDKCSGAHKTFSIQKKRMS